MPQFLSSIIMAGPDAQLEGVVIDSQASAPTAYDGRLWYDNVNYVYKYYDGNALTWKTFSAGAIVNAYTSTVGTSGTSTSSGSDTLTFDASDNSMTIVASDGPDTLDFNLSLIPEGTSADNIVFNTGKGVQTSTSSGNTVLFQAYDTDTGPGYVTFATLTAGPSPSFDLSTSTTIGGVAIVSTTGTQTLTNKTITTPILTMEQGTNPTNNTEGRLQWDTDGDKIVVGDGAGVKIFSDDSVSTNIHGIGASSSVVGTQTTQTLINKTIDASNNTLSNIGNGSLTNSTIGVRGDAGTPDTIALGETLDIAGDNVIVTTSRTTDNQVDILLKTDPSFSSGAWSWSGTATVTVPTPSADGHAANKSYVDGVAKGLDFKESVRLASTGDIAGTYTATGGTSGRGQFTGMSNGNIDGTAPAQGDRVLLKDQTGSGAENGIWVITTLGTGSNGVWDRADDFDEDDEVTSGAFCFVEEGTANGGSGWVLSTADPITIGGGSGTSLTFTQFSESSQYTGGVGIELDGSTFQLFTSVTQNDGINFKADSIGVARLTNGGIILNGQDLQVDLGATNLANALARADIATGSANHVVINGAGGALSSEAQLAISRGGTGISTAPTTGKMLIGQTAGTWTVASLGGTTHEIDVGEGDGSITLSIPNSTVTKNRIPRMHWQTIGDGISLNITVTHDLGQRHVTAQVYEAATPYAQVFCDIEYDNTTQTTFKFASEPASGEYYVVIVG